MPDLSKVLTIPPAKPRGPVVFVVELGVLVLCQYEYHVNTWCNIYSTIG